LDRGLVYYATLLRMLIDLSIPARLHLAGSFLPASEQERFRECSAGLEAHIIDHGWVAYDRLPDLLSSADVGLSVLMPEPRYVAALPVKLFEYMAAGLPVVASNFPPIANVVKTAHCGILVDPLQSPGAVADELASWWSDPQIPRDMGTNGRKAVLDRYNWESLAESLVNLYRRLIG
jgi:glycosyltransferase involved in cell wall biosynthesis